MDIYSQIFFKRDIFMHSILGLSAKFKAIIFSFPIWHRKKAFFHKCTPNYKDQKIETEKAKTYYISFLSLKSSDFKYVIFKIVEVSPWNPPANQHSRFGPHWVESGRIGCAA